MLQLYLLYLEGELLVEDEPLELIGSAVERSIAGMKRGPAGKRRKPAKA